MPGFSNSERLSFYAHIRTLESDFDKSQSQLRTTAAAWSGGVIAAVALTTVAIANASVLDAKESLFYVRELVCVVGSLGVFAFWYVDQSVYQRLLHSSFAYGLYLEQQNPDLPQMRSSLYWANLDITGRLGMFYRMQFWAFVVLAGLFLLFPPDPASIKLNLRFLVFGYAALGVFLLEMVTWDWASLDNTIRRLYPETLHRALPAGAATESAWLARIRAIPIPANPENPAQAGQLGAEAAVAAADPLEGG